MLFNGWMALVRTLVIGVFAYSGLILLLRLFGKRTLSKLNSFELIVTVALGSTLASAMTSNNVALVQALLAFSVLILLQFIVAWLGVRSEKFHRFITAEPTLLVYHGQLLKQAMKSERLTETELREVLREHGIARLEDVEAVVLEVNGNFSVLPGTGGASAWTLTDVKHYPPQSQ